MWVQENNFSRYINEGNGKGTSTSAVHISKNFGLKYLRTCTTQKVNTKGGELGIVKQEIASPMAQSNEVLKKAEKQEAAENNGVQFECLHLLISRNPVELFH